MTPLPPPPASPAPTAAPTAAPAAGCDVPPQWDSRTLLAGAREALIAHGDGVYRLRVTAAGKLILTK